MLKQFFIDETFICDVSTVTITCLLENPDNPTPDDIIRILKGHDKIVSTSSGDHEQFAQLRDQLEQQGYIETQRQWWNGDRVIKSFKLNEWTFRRGHKCPCAAAMSSSINCARKYGWKSISHL